MSLETAEEKSQRRKAEQETLRTVFLNSNADRKFKITEAHIRAFDEKRSREEGFHRFNQDGIPCSDAHKQAYKKRRAS